MHTGQLKSPQGQSQPTVLAVRTGRVGCITLNRPQALNALSLEMVRALFQTLLAWREDPDVLAVAIRGQSRTGPFGQFCAGGDIRFFHAAATAGDPRLEDFFTEEYRLNHLVQTYPKPYIAFMDGVVMGGGMGLSQGASIRVVTPRTRMAMPEVGIGLFPDVGGGFFLSRCPGLVGEWLALTGQSIEAGDAVAWGLADGCIDPVRLPSIWEGLLTTPFESGHAVEQWVSDKFMAALPTLKAHQSQIQAWFAPGDLCAIRNRLGADNSAFAQATLQSMNKGSPLMQAVALEQIRRARTMSLADALRMERDLVRRAFHPVHLGRPAVESEPVKGIRALVIDKDHHPRWAPEQAAEVSRDMVLPFFDSPWPAEQHPLRDLGR